MSFKRNNRTSLKVAKGIFDSIFNKDDTEIFKGIVTEVILDENNQLTMRTDDGIFVPVPNDKKNSVKNGQKISFGFRAEDIVPLRFGQKPNNYWDMQSKVNLAEPLGTETLIFTNFGSVEIVSRMFTPEQVNSDETLDFSLNLDRTYLFDGETGMAI